MAGSLTHVPLRLTYDEQMRLCVVLLIAAALAFLFLPKGDKEQKRRRFRPSRPRPADRNEDRNGDVQSVGLSGTRRRLVSCWRRVEETFT